MDEQEILKEKFKSAISSTVKAISGNFENKNPHQSFFIKRVGIQSTSWLSRARKTGIGVHI